MANEANKKLLAKFDKRNEKDKEEIHASYEDLIQRGFIKPLKSFSDE